MTRDEAYKAIKQIVDDPQNAEKLDKYRLSTKENGLGLDWFLVCAEALLKTIENTEEFRKARFENSFDVSIRHIQNILKKENLL